MSRRSGGNVRRNVAILFLFLLCGGGALGVALALGYLRGMASLPPVDVLYPENEYLDAVRSRVSLGDGREGAVEALSDAWYHAECQWGDGIIDVFLYGQQDEDVTTIGLLFLEADGVLVLEQLGILSDSVLGELGDCLPPGFLE